MIILNRHTSSLFSTFGVILSGNRVLCHTLELPWRHNAQEISCIPAGDYPVVLSNSNRFGPVFRLKDVPGREGILIHVGNYLHETRGCILPYLISLMGARLRRRSRRWRRLLDRRRSGI